MKVKWVGSMVRGWSLHTKGVGFHVIYIHTYLVPLVSNWWVAMSLTVKDSSLIFDDLGSIRLSGDDRGI